MSNKRVADLHEFNDDPKHQKKQTGSLPSQKQSQHSYEADLLSEACR